MDGKVLVKAENVSKKFCRDLKKSLRYGVHDILSELLLQRAPKSAPLRPDEFWALQDISFELRRGECLGLIGSNGAGKSTLLKLLSGLIKPSHGKITVSPRVGALIELGAGFNPVLTGLENIYINAAVLGISRREISKKIDTIIKFSELRAFIEMPVVNYSLGMKARLGFAIAAQMKPDVLIIDEVLAVGDVGFRAKCYNAIAEIAKNSAVIFVSHFMPHISRLATQALVLHRGHARFSGSTHQAVKEYYRLFETDQPKTRAGNGQVRIRNVKLINENGAETRKFEYGKYFRAIFDIYSEIDIEYLVLNLTFRTVADETVAECNNFVNPFLISLKAGQSLAIEIEIDELTLNAGLYKVSAFLQSSDMVAVFDWLQSFTSIEVTGVVATAGQQFKARWKAKQAMNEKVLVESSKDGS